MLLVFGLLWMSFSCAGACAWLANTKDRDPVGWFLLGFLFWFVALLLLGFLDKAELSSYRRR